MPSMQLVSCMALTLALMVSGAPTTPSSTEETQQQVQQVLLDLQLLLRGVNNSTNLILSRMLTFKFYMPKKATELKHLQCLEEELRPLQEVLNLAQSKNIHLKDTRDIISNIRVTVLKLKGSEAFLCGYNDETVTIVEFLNRWITFCQGIIATLT